MVNLLDGTIPPSDTRHRWSGRLPTKGSSGTMMTDLNIQTCLLAMKLQHLIVGIGIKANPMK